MLQVYLKDKLTPSEVRDTATSLIFAYVTWEGKLKIDIIYEYNPFTFFEPVSFGLAKVRQANTMISSLHWKEDHD